MASFKTKQRARARPKQASDSKRIEREYRRLALAIGDVDGFRLYLATYNDPRRRDQLIERLIADGERQKLQVTRLEVGGCGRETSLVRLLREHIQEIPISPGWRRAVMVVGLEELLDYANAREGLAVLETANLQRDAFPKAAPVPAVFWLSPLASSAFPKAAPDLWHWRGASFDFTGHAESRADLLRDIINLPFERAMELPDPQRRDRAALLEELLAELERAGPPKSAREAAERTDLLHELGWTYQNLGRSKDALVVFERQLAIAPENLKFLALSNLGRLFLELGDTGKAVKYYQKALEDVATNEGKAFLLDSLGDAYRQAKCPTRAIEYYQQALEALQEVGDKHGEAIQRISLGDAYRALGMPARASEYYKTVLDIARDMSDRQIEASVLIDLGLAYGDLDERERAITCLDQGREVARQFGESKKEVRALGNLGILYLRSGELDRAIQHFEQALDRARKIGDRKVEGLALRSMGHAYIMAGEAARALELLNQGVQVARALGEREDEANGLYGAALAKITLGERDAGVDLARQALSILEEIGAEEQAGNVREMLATYTASSQQ